MTNELNCPLSKHCKLAGNEKHCTDKCNAYISIMSRFNNTDVQRDYRNIFIDNSVARESQLKIYRLLDEYIKTFNKTNVRIKNLYLYSANAGTGKTTTAVAILNEYVRRRFMYYVSNKKNVSETLALFLDINEFQTEYNLSSMSNDSDSMNDIKDMIIRYSEVEFLVIDDVGVRSSTDSFRALVHSIINSRVTNALPTVFTSNVRLDELNLVFDERLQDRIKDQCLVLNFEGESKRGRR